MPPKVDLTSITMNGGRWPACKNKKSHCPLNTTGPVKRHTLNDSCFSPAGKLNMGAGSPVTSLGDHAPFDIPQGPHACPIHHYITTELCSHVGAIGGTTYYGRGHTVGISHTRKILQVILLSYRVKVVQTDVDTCKYKVPSSFTEPFFFHFYFSIKVSWRIYLYIALEHTYLCNIQTFSVQALFDQENQT